MSSIMPKQVDTVKHKRASGPSLLDTVQAVMHALRAQHQHATRAAGGGLSPLEGRVLGYFATHPGATQSDLAAHTGRDKGQLARLMAGLRERGLIAVRADPDDRRVVRVSLTREGMRLQEVIQRHRQQLDERVAGGFDRAETAQLTAWLLRLRERIEDAG